VGAVVNDWITRATLAATGRASLSSHGAVPPCSCSRSWNTEVSDRDDVQVAASNMDQAVEYTGRTENDGNGIPPHSPQYRIGKLRYGKWTASVWPRAIRSAMLLLILLFLIKAISSRGRVIGWVVYLGAMESGTGRGGYGGWIRWGRPSRPPSAARAAPSASFSRALRGGPRLPSWGSSSHVLLPKAGTIG